MMSDATTYYIQDNAIKYIDAWDLVYKPSYKCIFLIVSA